MVLFFNKIRRLMRAGPGLRFSLAWHTLGAAIGFLFATALVILDPFDLDRGIAERGRDAFYEIAAFAYPEARSPPTMVVLLDDAFLRRRKASWPTPYSVHASAIETIAARQPRAIVVDFLFLDERDDPSIAFLIETMRRVSETVPIYLAAPPSSVLGKHARPEIQALVAETEKIKFVSVEPGRNLGTGSTYPLTSEDPGLRPAAVALYEDLCRVTGDCKIEAGQTEMDIWWAIPRIDEFNCRGELEQVCARRPGGPFMKVFSTVPGMFSAILPEAWRPLNPLPIPYAPTVGLADLLDGVERDKVWDRLRGAVVFYGGNLTFAVDREMTPLQGQLPSVHAHAMAYDNLHALNGVFIKARPPFGFDSKAHLILLILILAFIGLLTRIIATLRRPKLLVRPHRRDSVFGVLDGAAFTLGALGIAIFEFSVLHIGPYAWAPVLAAVAAGDFLSSRRLTGRALLMFARLRKVVKRKIAKSRSAATPEPDTRRGSKNDV